MMKEPVKEAPVMEEEELQEKAEETEKEISIPAKKMAIPQWSVSQLANRAKSAGDAPEIVKDDITKVTLFDYSDIVGEEEEEE